jgi:hypothetical protein
MEADISTLRKTGHFYFALTPVNLYAGRGCSGAGSHPFARVCRLELAADFLPCVSSKRNQVTIAK